MNTLPIVIENVSIHQDAQGRYCMNDLHKASGGEKRHQPSNWLVSQQIIELIEELSIPGIPGIEKIQPVSSKQGIGTFVVKELVYAYAMWVSAKFHLKVIRTFDAVVSQAFNVACTWEQQRQGSKKIRAAFTDTLKEHGVAGFGFAQCTNGIYQPLFGGTAKKLKAKKGLAPKDSLRDAMSVEELAFTTVAEVVASQRMEVNTDQGNLPCYKTCKASGQAVRGLLVKNLD